MADKPIQIPDSWWSWPFNPAHDATVAGWGFWLSIVSFALTLIGFAITFFQIAKTKSAVKATTDEAKRIENSIRKHNVAQDISRAEYALRSAKDQFKNSAWQYGTIHYEEVRKSILSIKSNSSLNEEIYDGIDRAESYIDKLCERIDKNIYPTTPGEYAKLKSIMRSHEKLLSSIQLHVHKANIK